ncbi:MAG: hypothetical protein ACRDZ0_12380 [Acidimicrobiales bacterium]
MGKPGAPLTLATLTALALLVAGCGGDDDGGEAGRTSSTFDDEATTTEHPREALEAEVVAAYEASWTDFINAGDPPSPDAEFLADHLAGDALDVSRNLLRQYHAEGVVLRGTFEVDASVTELSDGTAVVEDCALDQLEVIVPDSGRVAEGHDDEREGFVAELTMEGGLWKVISLMDDDQVCG